MRKEIISGSENRIEGEATDPDKNYLILFQEHLIISFSTIYASCVKGRSELKRLFVILNPNWFLYVIICTQQIVII